MTASIQIKGLEQLFRDMNEASKIKFIKRHVRPVAENVIDDIKKYPPAPPKAGKRTWYARGFGLRWIRQDGSTGGIKTTKDLGDEWRIAAKKKGIAIGNRAPYSEYVHGDEQADWLALYGWEKLRRVIERHLPGLERRIANLLERKLGGR